MDKLRENADVLRPRRLRPDRLLPVVVLAVVTWLALLPRAIPHVESDDRGIFVTVAEKLIAGQPLYAGVWDNKDPLFYYSIAVGRFLGPLADPVIEVGWLLLAAWAIWVIASWSGLTKPMRVVASFIVTPVILTGSFYIAGYAHLPGLAISLSVLAAAVRRHAFLSGLLLGMTWFVNIRLFPVALAFLLVPFVVQQQTRRLWVTVSGLLAAAAAVSLILASRGEFGPYLDMLSRNAAYSATARLLGTGNPALAHLDRVLVSQALIIIWLVIAALGLVAAVRVRPQHTGHIQTIKVLWLAAALSLIAALASLSFTGLYPHHDQVLYASALVACLLAMVALQGPSSRALVLGISWLCIALAVGGVAWRDYANAAMNPRGALAELAQLSPEAAALRTVAPVGSYVRLGQGDDQGHGYGTRGWKLECPKFHQYPFDPPEIFADSRSCLDRANVAIVSKSLVPYPWNPPWNSFVASVNSVLARDFECRQFDGKRLCVRR